MRDACRKALACAARFDRAPFAGDDAIQDATIRQLDVLGQAAGRVGVLFPADQQDVPQAVAQRTRNVLLRD